jgi:4-hydroxy 2-oxovalerate aldolase
MKILDCTLRDGGYYTDWDYPEDVLNTYFDCIKNLPIDIVEIGYIGAVKKESVYKGKFYYLSPAETKKIKKKLINKDIALMIDTKDWKNLLRFKNTLKTYCGIVDVIRFAIDWKSISKQQQFIRCAKDLNFKVCVNLMYCHEFIDNDKFKNSILHIKDHSDVIYFVDSFGSLLPGQLTRIIKKFKSLFPEKKFGFHGHNNLELGLSNSIEAVKNGAYIVDSTITGMGRGAGNLKTELFLSYLNNLKTNNIINFDILNEVIAKFEILKKKYEWGTNLAYMLSGSNKIPQSNVIKFINSRRLSFSDLLSQARNKKELNNNSIKNIYSKKFPKLKNVMLIGGGETVKNFSKDLITILKKNKKLKIIFAGSKNLDTVLSKKINNTSYLCLGGSDFNKNVSKIIKYKNLRYLINDKNLINFKNNYNKKYIFNSKNKSEYLKNSQLLIALESIKLMQVKNVFFAGFDGYKNQKPNIYSNSLNEENQQIIDLYKNNFNFYSLTPTVYKGLKPHSLFKELLKSDNSLSSL